MTKQSNLSQMALIEVVAYDPASGEMTWRRKASNKATTGSPVGATEPVGYRITRIRGEQHRVHRLAWLYMTGVWPSGVIDHIDGNKANNRWANLRDVTHEVNMGNRHGARSDSKSKLIGALWCSQTGKWRARIKSRGRQTHLGRFSTPEEASAAYLQAKARQQQERQP